VDNYLVTANFRYYTLGMKKKSSLFGEKPSKRQAEVLKFIVDFQKENSYSPSLAEIASFFDVSIPTIHQHITYLQQKNLVAVKKNKKRSIDVRENMNVSYSTKNIKFDSFTIPILGAANAGPATLFADENVEGYLKVTRSELNRKDGMFALRVEGDSMNQAKIDGKYLEEGDFVLIDSENKNPRNGDYVLSILDDCANLKKFKRDSRTQDIMLISESTNPKHKPIYISSEDNFMVNGKIVNVIKK